MTNSISFPIEIPYSKRKSLTFLFILTLVVASIYAYLLIGREDNSRKMLFITWIGIPVYVIAFISGLLFILRRKPGIRIDEKGVWYKRGDSTGQFVPWEHIKGFEMKRHSVVSTALLILVTEPDLYVQGDYKEVMAKNIMLKKHGTPLSIPYGFYDQKPEDLTELLNECHSIIKKFNPSKNV